MDIGNPLDFTDRVVVVTGGTKGIGFTLAGTFLAAGAHVVVCGRGAPRSLPSANGRRAVFLAADVRDPDAANALIDGAVARFGRLDVLVNNAGGSPDADAATVSPRFVEKVAAPHDLPPLPPPRAVTPPGRRGTACSRCWSRARARTRPGRAGTCRPGSRALRR